MKLARLCYGSPGRRVIMTCRWPRTQAAGWQARARMGRQAHVSEGHRQAYGPSFVYSRSCCVNPLAFHNKSQIINKYMLVMSRLFNRRNWKMQCEVIISLSPRLCSDFLSPSLPGPASAARLPLTPALSCPGGKALVLCVRQTWSAASFRRVGRT